MNEEGRAIDALKDIALESLKEQKRTRRWGIFFKLLFLAYLLGTLFLVFNPFKGEAIIAPDKITALVDVKGVIMDNSEASADMVVGSLRNAFKHEKTKGVIIRINSPGGSPVQAGYINDEIRRLKAEYKDIPVYAVVSDICASGGYYIAVAADEIYADKASLVGSIGVRMDSFGFVEAMKKLGVERRLYTAGTNKGMLDPFSPENPAQVAHIDEMLDVTHQQFIKVVKDGRGDRLKDSPEIFSGLFWTGETAVELGLVDGLGSTSYVAREIIGAEHIQNFTAEKDLLQRLSDRISTSLSLMIRGEAASTPRTVLY